MTAPDSAFEPGQAPEALLAHGVWVRRLALRLLGDGPLAEELVQDTWAAALAGGDARHGDLKSWLGGIVRNLAHKRIAKRTRERHDRRGQAIERLAPAAEEVLELEEQRRRVVNAVLALEEPLRATLLLRFFEDLSSEEIARREGVPASSIRTRVQRGLERLRERLREPESDPESPSLRGLAWLAPLAGRRPTPPAGSAPAPKLPNAPLVPLSAGHAILLLAGVTALGGLAWRLRVSGPQGPDPGARSVRMEGEHRTAGIEQDTPMERGDQRSPLRVTTSAKAPGVPDGAAISAPIRGRVLGPTGAPLAGVRVVLLADPAADTPVGSAPQAPISSLADDSGDFELRSTRQAPLNGSLHVEGPDHVTLRAGLVYPGQDSIPVVIAAPARSIVGTIVETGGSGLSGAQLAFELPVDFAHRFREILDATGPPVLFRAESGSDGHFELERAPDVHGATWRVVLAEFVTGHFPAPSDMGDPGARVRWSLRRPMPGSIAVSGEVRDEHERPVAGAYVGHGMVMTRTGVTGRFQFLREELAAARARHGTPAREDSTWDVVAASAGRGMARASLTTGEGTGERAPIVLRISRSAGRIAGRVLDADRAPVEGALIWVREVSVLGYEDGRIRVLEDVLAPGPESPWHRARTDATGAFTLGGLEDHAYTLVALDPENGARTELHGVRAGQSTLLARLPRVATWEAVTGRVTSATGAPVSGVRVGALIVAQAVYWAGSDIAHSPMPLGPTAATDEDGFFVLQDVPRSTERLMTNGAGTRVSERWILPEERAESVPNVDIDVELRFHVVVESTQPAEADGFAFCDVDGMRIPLQVYFGDKNMRQRDMEALLNGTSELVSTSERAVTLVLLQGGRTVRSVPVVLLPGRVNLLRP